jgi:hypothetical protein
VLTAKSGRPSGRDASSTHGRILVIEIRHGRLSIGEFELDGEEAVFALVEQRVRTGRQH